LYEQDDEDIDPSHKACPICGSVHFKKNGKDKNGHQRYDISVLTVTSLLVIEPTPYSTGLILLWTSGFTSLNWNYIKCL
ncbi:transposase, partial [Catenibacterium mitsuokai]